MGKVAVNQSPLNRFVVRKRIFFSLLLPMIIVIFARPTPGTLAAGVALVVVGEAIRIWAAGCISKNRELACTGPFAYVRNPLYVGSLLIGIGYCVMSGLWWSFLVMAGFYYWFYFGTIVSEEEHLRSVLGDAYERYTQAVPRLIPRLSPWRGDGPAFTWDRVWHNREYESIVGVTLFTLAFVVTWLIPNTTWLNGL